MPDVVTKAVRSRMMAGIRGKHTKPELLIRRGLFARGYRFRLHGSGLPGKPDLVLRKHSAVILVHGCFWHRHRCALFKWPSSNVDFWRTKLTRNVTVGDASVRALRAEGWRVLVVWECALKGPERKDLAEVIDAVCAWLESDLQESEIAGRAGGAPNQRAVTGKGLRPRAAEK